MESGSDASTMLEDSGLRPTEVRRRVLSSLLGAACALSHREIVDLLAGLDRVTVYRNLKLLKEAGLVHGVHGIDGSLRYIVNPAGRKGCPGGHPHFLCLECGTMSCLVGQELPRVSVPRSAEVRGKQFLAYGLCAACARSKRVHPARPPRRGATG
jgi:Fe2+ or Zn2+ uptake regulation protein